MAFAYKIEQSFKITLALIRVNLLVIFPKNCWNFAVLTPVYIFKLVDVYV